MPFNSAWILEFSKLENHTEKEQKMIMGYIDAGMWQVTRDGEPAKDSAYWQQSATEYGRKYSNACREYYAPNTDKRTKKYRLWKDEMRRMNCFTTVCELYRLRELKREAAKAAN